MKCRICLSNNTINFLSLGHQPPSDAFLAKEQLNEPEVYYPLDLYFCEDCKLVQLGYTVDPKELFNENYAYTTGTSKDLVKNFQELTAKLTQEYNLNKDDLAIDIGSNDGTLLEGYTRFGIKILGVEPTGTADLAVSKGIRTVKEFFNESTAKKILQQEGKAKIITATNMFAHVDTLSDFIEGINLLLTDDGVFISESHHLLSLIGQFQFDSIYHEHLRYYSLKPLIYLFKMHNMDLFNVELITTHGGSLRVYACKRGAYKILGSVQEVIKLEEAAGLYSKEKLIEYQKRAIQCRENLQEMIREIKREGARIVGIGAPAKGNTLLNYCQLTADTIDYLAEHSKLKIDKYSPGAHIPVLDEKKMLEEQPEYGLLLSWNLKDIIIPKLREKGYKGKVIVPIPTPIILN